MRKGGTERVCFYRSTGYSILQVYNLIKDPKGERVMNAVAGICNRDAAVDVLKCEIEKLKTQLAQVREEGRERDRRFFLP